MPGGKLKWGFAPSRSLGTQRHFSRVTALTLVHPFGTLVQIPAVPTAALCTKTPPSKLTTTLTHTHSGVKRSAPDLVSLEERLQE